MRYWSASLISSLALAACATSPTTSSAINPAPVQVQSAKPGAVKKQVCERVDAEETTGSRVGDAPKVCKIIEVPADGTNAPQ